MRLMDHQPIRVAAGAVTALVGFLLLSFAFNGEITLQVVLTGMLVAGGVVVGSELRRRDVDTTRPGVALLIFGVLLIATAMIVAISA